MIDTLLLILSNPALRYNVGTIGQVPSVQGLDISFEVGETYTTRQGYHVDRIVRVGSTKDLNRRFNDHYFGNVNSSAFREAVMTSLAANNQPHSEADISAYFAQNITCMYIPGEFAAAMKPQILSLINNSPNFDNSPNWSGVHANFSKVWQRNDLNGRQLSQNEFSQLSFQVG